MIDDGSGLPVGFDLSASPSLGLSIVRTLVGELGGTVEITDGEQGGTVVSLRLPDVERAS